MGFSRSTLNRYVRQWLGMGFHEYVQEVRMEEAKRLLRSSRQSVAQIARECGFSSSGYFIRAFKKGLGKTPQQYRQNPG
jgi:AraC-like DNA-binding protein